MQRGSFRSSALATLYADKTLLKPELMTESLPVFSGPLLDDVLIAVAGIPPVRGRKGSSTRPERSLQRRRR